MKPKRLVILAAALLLVLGATSAFAFHEGGAATCTRCHSMHSAKQSSSLLASVDTSSTCLSCHQGTDTAITGSTSAYKMSTSTTVAVAGVPPTYRTPGGDFRWLSKDTSWTLPRPGTAPGKAKGHNIVAAGTMTGSTPTPFNYVADTTNVTAPGGTMASSQLGCANCHDPHGQSRRYENGEIHNPVAENLTTYPPIEGSGSYPDPLEPEPGYALGTYRLLGGPGYIAHGSTTFPGAPPAIAPAAYNRYENVTQTRVAYGTPVEHTVGTASWAQWCGTCHPNYHVAPAGTFTHPVDDGLGTEIAANYNKYIKTGDLTGTDSTSYTSLVPFAENTNDYAVLASHAVSDNSFLNGPSDSDRVMCLTCHRAHASAWDNAWRWNQAAELLTLANETTGAPEYAATNNAHAAEGTFHRGYSEAEMLAAYYERPATTFAGFQRSMCNKCHIKD
ncbi:MAG TPA: cytochrome c3 family protein [Candidatus Polarisedimenticolaceae bacterium]|nr:cytochrome c3 family protein [Candidatus Polarisedimenticolaceae bacterium]